MIKVGLSSNPSPWCVVQLPRPEARLRLFAFPYAGAGASIYSSWGKYLSDDVECYAIQMPGREGRLSEPPIASWDILIPQLASSLLHLFDRPFAFFGHSLGAAIAFELSRYLQRSRLPEPVHLCVSGRRAPQFIRESPPTYDLPTKDFSRELARWGTPKEVLDEPELLDVFLPLLRADFCLSESHGYTDGSPLNCPISAYGGALDEHIRSNHLQGWSLHTANSFRSVLFPGGHFFLNENRSLVISDLNQELKSVNDPRSLLR
ncbi:MAG: thioesterase [Acidobacteriaceae bacterium]|nr:thioesterase [Acidobacteriaceae bacterium]